jgi:hypothetical protein
MEIAMTKYKAKNNTEDVTNLAIERAKYKVNSFEDDIGYVPKNVVDFNFADRVFYGRIDNTNDTTYTNEALLKIIPQDGESHFVLNFVEKQFELFRKKFKQAVSFGLISSDDPFLSDIKVYRGYEDPINLYKLHIGELILSFNEQVDASEIRNYDDWINAFIKFQKRNGPRFPTTLSGFQRTSKSNIFTSGLALSIANLDCGDDTAKSQFFLENDVLEFYTKTALQFGFYIHKSCPWILVSDINSPSTILYRENLGLSRNSLFFSEISYKCYEEDLSYLRVALEEGYQEFIFLNPFIKEFSLKCNKTYKNITERNININNNIYNNIFYINKYIIFKNIEEYNYLSEPEEARVKQKAEIFAKKLDNSRAMDYINTQFKASYKTRSGTLNDLLNKTVSED